MSKDQVYEYLEKPFNPPAITEHFTEKDFYSEWHNVRSKLKEVLDRFGKSNAFGDADYCMADSAALSRGISVEITSNNLMTSSLIPAVMSFLKELPNRYEIEFGIETEQSTNQIFVSAERVKGCCSEDVLELLEGK